MFDINKSVKKMLGNSKPFGKIDFNNRVNSVNRVMKNLIGDRDGDKVINIMDCKPRDRTKHGGQLMWKKIKEKGIRFARQGVEKDDPDLAKGKEAYIEKDVQWHKDNLYKDDYNKEDDVRIRKQAAESYEKQVKRRDIPTITKREKKWVRKAFEKDPTLLEEARDTVIYTRDPEDYKVEVVSKEKEEARRRSNIQVVPQRKTGAGDTEWRDAAEDPHDSPLTHFQEGKGKRGSKWAPYQGSASDLKIDPELLHRGVVGKTHSPRTARAIHKLPLRQPKDGTEVVVKQEELLASAEPVKGSDYKIKGSRVAGVMAHELKGRYQLYGAKGPAGALKEGRIPEPRSKMERVDDYREDPRERGRNIEKEEATKKKVLGMREENVLSPEEITRLDELQRTGKITKDQREKILTHIEKKYRNVSIYEKREEGYTGDDKTFGRLIDAFAEMGAGRIVDPTTIQARHRFAAQFRKREEAPKSVGEEKFRTMMDKGPVKPISKKEPQIRPGYTYTKLPKGLLSEDTIKKAEKASDEGSYSPRRYLFDIVWHRRIDNINQSQYAEMLTDAVNDPQISNNDYVREKGGYINSMHDALYQKKVTKEEFAKELGKTVKEHHKTPGYYKEKSKMIKERFK